MCMQLFDGSFMHHLVANVLFMLPSHIFYVIRMD
uniref:Uncharacterized protein n=1 Tax=Manihot esculenta TaxID=3983 RepID=A0A2C9V8Z5_MANES